MHRCVEVEPFLGGLPVEMNGRLPTCRLGTHRDEAHNVFLLRLQSKMNCRLVEEDLECRLELPICSP